LRSVNLYNKGIQYNTIPIGATAGVSCSSHFLMFLGWQWRKDCRLVCSIHRVLVQCWPLNPERSWFSDLEVFPLARPESSITPAHRY